MRIASAAVCTLLALGCASIPLGEEPGKRARRQIVVGLFPGIGEAHLNDRASNGDPLTPGLRAADYTLRPLYVAAVNVLSLGFPTVASWLLEPYEDWSPQTGPCGHALLGFCKSAKKLPSIPEGEPGLTQRNWPDDDRAPLGEGSSR
jgi:hypothetical protein